MHQSIGKISGTHLQLERHLRAACTKIAPVWPLENFVAVNPYLGLSHKKFEEAAHELAHLGGVDMTMPLSFYKDKIREGEITAGDIAAVLAAHPHGKKQLFVEFIDEVNRTDDNHDEPVTVETLADTVSAWTGQDWNRFMLSRISGWAASYFDRGQAAWPSANNEDGLFKAWKTDAETDVTPEIMGLKNFRRSVGALPGNYLVAAQFSLEILHIPEPALSNYLHRLLLKAGGWAAHAARIDWDKRLYGAGDGSLMEFLAVLICWEACAFQSLLSSELRRAWDEGKKTLSDAGQKRISRPFIQRLILQEALDRSVQRGIVRKFQPSKVINTKKPRVKVQAVFCIDVRSEIYRRNLEMADPKIETLGFAGFFGFPINYIPVGHDRGEAKCPVLLKTGPNILEGFHDSDNNRRAYKTRIQRHQISEIWRSFKSGAVTCFSFVSPVGLSYLPKLFTDSFGLTRPVAHPDEYALSNSLRKEKTVSLDVGTYEHMQVGMTASQRNQMAKSVLSAMSLTSNFARYVLIVGHGSTTVNNPHATGLDCGACGGHSGEANARVAAAVLNDRNVREYLRAEHIIIPDTTIFLSCLHDTTTDDLSILNEHEIPPGVEDELQELKEVLEEASMMSRTERAARLSVKGDVENHIRMRSRDWSQVRPEWGLAGCSAFVVAPRERTKDIDFGGRAFLHSYDWKRDPDFAILELIMTAPMVVTSWISLQYFASTVDNRTFGSGNKTLHNITAGIGVLEGFSGDLRVGLPLQSVHDGERFQHDPVRLNVIIEAPMEAMNRIIKKHQSVGDLVNNGWLHLLAMNEQGKVAHRYMGDLSWEDID